MDEPPESRRSFKQLEFLSNSWHFAKFLSDCQGTFSFYKSLENSPIFQQHFWYQGRLAPFSCCRPCLERFRDWVMHCTQWWRRYLITETWKIREMRGKTRQKNKKFFRVLCTKDVYKACGLIFFNILASFSSKISDIVKKLKICLEMQFSYLFWNFWAILWHLIGFRRFSMRGFTTLKTSPGFLLVTFKWPTWR